MAVQSDMALICGNGLSISRVAAVPLNLNPSSPLRWDINTPAHNSKLIDDLPALKNWLSVQDPGRVKDDFRDLIIPFTGRLDPTSPVPQGLPEKEVSVLLDLTHYLAVAYSWFQLELDHYPMRGWGWVEWCVRNRRRIRAVLSWNYDLVVERLLYRSRLPFKYAGITSSVVGAGRGPGQKDPVLLAKPHGSCNFAPDGMFLATVGDGGLSEPMTYPRLLHVTGYDGPIRLLSSHEMFSIRQVADLVLPGEQNRFRKHLKWVERTWSEFVEVAAPARELLIVGFRMAEPDRKEFEDMLSQLESVNRITVVDPKPNLALVETLKRRAPVTVIDTIPT